MSRLGKLPIKLPGGVEARIEDGFLTVKGPKGELKQKLHRSVKTEIADGEIRVSSNSEDNKKERAFWGLYWSLANNMVRGVTEGFGKKLEISGVGYRAALNGRKLVLSVGFSHPVEYALPEGINAQVEGNAITVNGIDKQLVGEVAAQIRRIKKPEPYKGKGIKYSDEIIRRKEGKTASKGS